MKSRSALLFALLVALSPVAYAADPCCGITAIDQATGVVTMKNLKTGKVTTVKVNKAKLKSLRVGQKVGSKL